MKRIIMTGAILLGSLISFNSVAQPQMSEEDMQKNAVASRQAVFKLLGVAMGPLGGMARGGEYDEAAAKLSAERIMVLADMIPELFAMDTSSNSDLATKAQNGIWGAQADFAGLAADLTAGATAALETLNSKGADGVRQAVGQIGQKCGACHDRFRMD